MDQVDKDIGFTVSDATRVPIVANGKAHDGQANAVTQGRFKVGNVGYLSKTKEAICCATAETLLSYVVHTVTTKATTQADTSKDGMAHSSDYAFLPADKPHYYKTKV